MPLPPMPPPALVNLESTLGCNLECVMCGSHMAGVTRKRQIMSPELLSRVEAQVLPGARDLSLTVAGEPLMTPKLGTFIALAERQGLALQLNSNATLLREGELLDRLLRQSSVLKFSVDGARASTYESIRVQSNFELVIGNIRKAVAARARLPRSQRPRLAICMVLMRRNAEELVELVELAHDLGVDRLEVAHLTVLSDELEPESLRHHPELCDRVLAEARRRADELAFRLHLPPDMAGRPLPVAPSAQLRLALRELRELNPRRLRRLGHTLQQKMQARAWELRAGGRVPCHFLQGGVFVTLGGDVAPCPMPGRPIAGNLLEQSFAEIWNGPVLSAMRRGFLEGRPFACCAHCSQNPVNYQPADPQTARPPGYRPGRQERVY
jgi:MoaA/NifB/PqqE/SkfB family radical SAM enzyme